MREFAKLFTAEGTQVLVVKCYDDNPEIKITFDPSEDGSFLCTVNMRFEDSDEGEQRRDALFDTIDVDDLASIVRKTRSTMCDA